VILVCDNLNTHTRGASYDAFPPEEVRELGLIGDASLIYLARDEPKITGK